MAGSRLEKIRSIFRRTEDLLRAGVLPEAQKPTWFDVYAAFPPLREPVYRPLRPQYGKRVDPVPPIFYPEDAIRAKFYETYGNGPRAFDLTRLDFKSPCQRFVEKYTLLQKQGEIDREKLFEETGKALLAEGVILRRKGAVRGDGLVRLAKKPVLETPTQNVEDPLQQTASGPREEAEAEAGPLQS